MAEKLQNTSVVKTTTFSKGMVKDVNDMYMSEGVYNHAINAINNTHYGEVGTIGNEPANRECASAPFAIIGYAYKSNGQWVLFSTRQSTHGSITTENNSDIGIFDEATCTYTSIFNEGDNTVCLDFAVVNPITAVCKENYDCTWSAYWQDAYNPDRVINLDNPAYSPNPDIDDDPCTDEGVTQTLDCDAIRLHPLVEQPCLKIRKSKGGGQLTNGSYMAVIAYSENGVRLTDYSMPSPATGIWSHEGIGGSIEILLSNADNNFNEFELVVIAVVNQQTIAKRIGHYPINIDNIHLDQILQSLPTVDLATIPMKNMVYEKSDKMFEINNHLVRCGVTAQPYFNYQPLANNIRTKWVAVKYPKEYYFSGGTSVGYMRDEVYSFFIRWIYATGARSASYHIPGRAPVLGFDRNPIGNDPNIVYSTELERWQVYDTSSYSNISNGNPVYDSIENIEGIKTAQGAMSYWESTEHYPADTEIWGDLCNLPIRHHKMPSNETIPISVKENEKEYVLVLGVAFDHIAPPVDTDGNIIEDVVGYEILRGSREGNKSIVAKGLFNNMVEYEIPGINQTGLIQNYPYNDVRPDPFLVTNMINMTNSNDTALPLDTYKQDIFSFHSPETNFVKPYIGDSYIKLYNETSGLAKGKFSHPYLHPQHKVISTASFLLAIPVAVGIGIVAAMGKTTFSTDVSGGLVIADAGVNALRGQGSATAIPDLIANMGYQGASVLGVGGVIATIAGIVVMASNFIYYFGQGMDQVLSVIRNVSKWRNYLLQYNSHGIYDMWHNISYGVSGSPVEVAPCVRRVSSELKYIGSHVQDFNSDYRINNINRNKYVCIQVNKAIGNVSSVEDASKKGVDDYFEPFTERKTKICSYYGAIKIDYQNQYGQLDSIVQLPTNSCIYVVSDKSMSTDVIFGGDTYINRYTEKNPYMFFNTWMFDQPNGTEFNYRNYVNGPVPTYWVDTNTYDMTDTEINFQSLFSGWFDGSQNNDQTAGDVNADPTDYFGTEPVVSLPNNFFNFDGPPDIASGWLVKRNSYAYLFYNGVRDFFVESELNLAYRDYGEDSWEKFHDTHYENHFNNLDMMFRSDLITKAIYHKYDMSLSVSKLFSGFASWGKILPRDYDPTLYTSCFEYLPKRVIYSLKQIEGSKRDNWRNYLPLNYKDFKGKVSVMKSLNATGTVILFEDKEPIFFQGVDQLQSQSGNKFTVGDGGLFANTEQTMVNADDSIGYGECISSRSAVNTPFGLFWISQKSGKIFQYAGGTQPEEITRSGMKHWFNENLPSKMLTTYPNYPHYDNPIIGVSCQTIYDPQYELVYFIKKDYRPLQDYYTFDKETPFITNVSQNIPTYPSILPNTLYFQDASWVASYDPKSKAWVSFHTWNPSLVIPSVKHFYTVNPLEANNNDLNLANDYIYTTGQILWKHNERYDDFCRYYNNPSYWEIDYPIVTNNQITTLRNVEYELECFVLAEQEYDKAHKLDENFDRALVYNSEQISGWLYLINKPKNDPYTIMSYPQYVNAPPHYNILFSKEENKYRFNQFWDIVRDRGEFTHGGASLFTTTANGVDRRIVNTSVNYLKPMTQRKKFRHYGNNLLLRRVSRNNQAETMPKMVLKLSNNKLLNSSR